jgi:hypothetical protein
MYWFWVENVDGWIASHNVGGLGFKGRPDGSVASDDLRILGSHALHGLLIFGFLDYLFDLYVAAGAPMNRLMRKVLARASGSCLKTLRSVSVSMIV